MRRRTLAVSVAESGYRAVDRSSRPPEGSSLACKCCSPVRVSLPVSGVCQLSRLGTVH